MKTFRPLLLGLVLLPALLCGCGAARHSTVDYYPDEQTARDGLAVVLRAWQQGQPPEAITDRTPVVRVVDTHRRSGQTLQDFEVLGMLPGDGPRQFTVRLTLDNPAEVKKVRFVVVGIDPLWVFRQENYDMLAHWECPMPQDTARVSTPAPAPSP
jgi:hypothetical protein